MRALWTGTRDLIRCEICYLVNITSKSFQMCSACGCQPLCIEHMHYTAVREDAAPSQTSDRSYV